MMQPQLPLTRQGPAPVRPTDARTTADLEALDRACRDGSCREVRCNGCPLADTGDDWREVLGVSAETSSLQRGTGPGRSA